MKSPTFWHFSYTVLVSYLSLRVFFATIPNKIKYMKILFLPSLWRSVFSKTLVKIKLKHSSAVFSLNTTMNWWFYLKYCPSYPLNLFQGQPCLARSKSCCVEDSGGSEIAAIAAIVKCLNLCFLPRTVFSSISMQWFH